jgi:hypothetical protein
MTNRNPLALWLFDMTRLVERLNENLAESERSVEIEQTPIRDITPTATSYSYRRNGEIIEARFVCHLYRTYSGLFGTNDDEVTIGRIEGERKTYTRERRLRDGLSEDTITEEVTLTLWNSLKMGLNGQAREVEPVKIKVDWTSDIDIIDVRSRQDYRKAFLGWRARDQETAIETKWFLYDSTKGL